MDHQNSQELEKMQAGPCWLTVPQYGKWKAGGQVIPRWGTENGSGDTWKTTTCIHAGPSHAVVRGLNSLPRTSPKAMSPPGAQQRSQVT